MRPCSIEGTSRGPLPYLRNVCVSVVLIVEVREGPVLGGTDLPAERHMVHLDELAHTTESVHLSPILVFEDIRPPWLDES
jgi:hypothetical protein